MGYRQTQNISEAYVTIRQLANEVSNPRNDGWVASGCKRELFQLKCFIDDLYQDLPTFTNEPEWEKERLLQLMKRK